jgi:transcriptional regulator of met regulon
MSKFSFRHGELDKLDKKIKAFNRKVEQLKSQGYKENLIPEKMSYKVELAKIIHNENYVRQDFKDTFSIMDAFLKKGSEKLLKSSRGMELPKFKKKEIDIKVKRINKERAKLQKQYDLEPLTDRNEPIEMPEENKKLFRAYKITPKKFNWKNMSRKDFEMFQKTLVEYDTKQDEKDKLYRENFYKALDNQLLPDDAKRIKEILDKIPTNEIVKKYYTDLNMDIDFIYDKSDYEGKIESIIESWNSLKREGGY